MLRRIVEFPKEETRQSYLGLLKYGETFKIIANLERKYFESQK